jgi:alanyl-tRNA synthetase
MHAALRQVLGAHVEQKGSLVNDERLRFDFSHFSKMTDEEIKQVERIVNEKIREDILNNTFENVPIEEAKNMGAMALFGEKYGDHVRVVAFDKEYSVELCGGTHIASTGRIGSFKILSEGAIAAGVRRIEAVTGDDVMCYLDNQLEQIAKIKEIVKTSGDLIKAIENLSAQNQMLQKKVEQMMQEKAVAEARNIYNAAVDFEGRKLVIARVEADVNQMRTIATAVKDIDAEAILLMGGIFEAKPALCVMIPQSLVDERKWDAGAMIREAAKEIQGGGGGQKTLATAGGKNVDGIDKAMEILKSKINN